MTDAYADSMSGASYNGQYSIQKSKAGSDMQEAHLLPSGSRGTFIMNVTPRYELTKRQPLRAVFRDNSYGSDSMKINAEQIFKLLSPMTELKSIW